MFTVILSIRNCGNKKKARYEENGKIALPYFLYIDDVVVNNTLGSHAMRCFSYAFPFEKKLEIYLGASVKSIDYKQYDNLQCLVFLVGELNKLERDGISIQTS